MVRWEVGNLTPNLSNFLTEEERQFFNDYSKCVFDYCLDLGGLELTTDICPPKSTTIRALVLKDVGSVLDRYGKTLQLQKNTVVTVNYTDGEEYIRQGILQHLGN